MVSGESTGSRPGNKHSAVEIVFEDCPQDAATVSQGKLGLILEEQAADNDCCSLSTIAPREDECRKKIKKKRKRERGEKEVSNMGDFGPSSPLSLLTANFEALDEYERSDSGNSSVSAVSESKRNVGSFEDVVAVAEGGNRGKKPNKDAQVASARRHSRRLSIHQLEAVHVDGVFVEMPSARVVNHRKKKKKKDCNGQASHSTIERDATLTENPHPDTWISGEKHSKKKSGSKTQGNSGPNKELVAVSKSDDVKVAGKVLLNNAGTGSSLFSARSKNGSCILQNYGRCGIIQGKRFSKEEDAIIKDAVSQYIERHKLGEKGLHMILSCQKYPQIKRGCWKEIAASIPWRLYTAVRKRAEKLFLTDWGHKWTPEEIEFVQSHVRENGKCWKSMADTLGVFWQQVFYAWRRNRNSNFQLGAWTQDEYKQLFDLVHKDLRRKAFIEKNDKHGILRENISWQTISDTMGTRVEDHIRLKWYRSLSSSMVRQGLWSDTDDYRLVDSLLKLDACCVEDVDWDNLLTNRSGDICRKRWMEMTKHIGGIIEKPFIEQVDLLSTRYCINMLEHRERSLENPS